MKKLMLVGLLTALIGVPIGNALAAEILESVEPNNLIQSGFYHVYVFVPSGFKGFDSSLFVGGFLGFNPVLEVDTVGLIRGPGGSFPVQSTNVSFGSLQVVALSSTDFKCAPQPNICQLFIHHLDPDPTHAPDFITTLVVTGPNGNFQFLPPTFTAIIP